MIVFLLFFILIGRLSSLQIEQSPTQFKVFPIHSYSLHSFFYSQISENCPNGTIVGTIEIFPLNSTMILMDNANGCFRLNSLGQLIVSVFIYSCNIYLDGFI